MRGVLSVEEIRGGFSVVVGRCTCTAAVVALRWVVVEEGWFFLEERAFVILTISVVSTSTRRELHQILLWCHWLLTTCLPILLLVSLSRVSSFVPTFPGLWVIITSIWVIHVIPAGVLHLWSFPLSGFLLLPGFLDWLWFVLNL